MSELKSYKGFKEDDRVQVKLPDEAYDRSGVIQTTDVGTIKSFAPKVRIINRPPLYDGLPYFAYVEFDRIVDTLHRNRLRGGIDICNLKHLGVR
jgi:hypothetical protein